MALQMSLGNLAGTFYLGVFGVLFAVVEVNWFQD
jgi:hypothetical protein